MSKITNPSKLLPSAKSTSITKITKSNLSTFVKPIKKTSATIKTDKDFKTTTNQEIEEVNIKLLEIKSFLNKDLLSSKKKTEAKRKQKEKKDFEEAEKKLETPQSKKLKLKGGASLPSVGLFDRIKRFLFFTALGWLVPRLIEFLPKLQGIANVIGGVYKFAEGLFGKLFDGFMSLVKFGGDLKKKTLGFIADLKVGPGGDYETEFKKLQNQFDTFVNISIIAGVLSADIGLAAVDEINKAKSRTGSGGYQRGYAAGYAAGLASRRGSTRYRSPGQAAAGRTLSENVARQRLTRERMLKSEGPKGPLDRVRRGFGGAAAQLQTGTLFPKGAGIQKAIYNAPGKVKNLPKKIPSLWNKMLRGPFAKLKGPLSKFAGAAVPGLGAAVGAADAKARFAAGDKIGGAIASVSAGLDGITTILALTGVGLPVAAALSAVSIGLDAILLINDIGKVIKELPMMGWVPTFKGGGRVVRKYQGGGTTGRPVGVPKRRSITPSRKKLPLIKAPKSQPGKDVGGEKNIKKLFPDKSKRFISQQEYENSGLKEYGVSYTQYLVTERQSEGKKPNPYKALTNTAKILKEIPLVGGIMGAAVDVALGQKPDRRVYQSLSNGISNLIESLANQKADKSMTSLIKDIRGFAEGGTVEPSRELKQYYGSLTSGDMIAKVLGTTIEERVNEAINSIEKEMKKVQEKRNAPGAPGAPGADDSPGARLRDGSNAQIEADLLEYYTALYGKTAAIGIVANLRRESGYRTRTPNNKIYEGMAQWSRDDRWPRFVKWAESKNLDPYSRNAQAQYVAVELKELGTDKRLKQAKTPEEAASIFYNEFERGAYSKPVKGNAYNPDNDHENKNKRFIQDITKSNPDIGKRTDDVLEKPKFTGGVLPSTKIGSKAGMREHPITGEYKMHSGNDYPMPEGTAITVLKEGEVTRSEVNGSMASGYGNLIEIRHSDGSRSVYAHLSERKVNVGDKIRPGQVIGTVGSTGGSTGSHLHFEYDNPNGSTETNWQTLNNKADKTFVFGNVKPSTAYKLAMSGNKEGIIENGEWKEKKWTEEERKRYEKAILQSSNSKNQSASTAQSFSASGIALANLNDRISKLKTGEKIVFDKVGSIQGGTGFFGRPQIKYYNSAGAPISKEDFDKLLAPSEVLKKMRSNDRQVQNMQDGGIAKPQKSRLPIPNSFASYESPGGGMMIALWPMIIEKQVPVSSGKNSMIDFVPVSVNNNRNSSLSIG